MNDDKAELEAADPKGILSAVLRGEDDLGYPARDHLLLWIMRLNNGMEPSRAAAALLARYPERDGDAEATELELRQLLADTARQGPCAPARRRGGRARRRSDN